MGFDAFLLGMLLIKQVEIFFLKKSTRNKAVEFLFLASD